MCEADELVDEDGLKLPGHRVLHGRAADSRLHHIPMQAYAPPRPLGSMTVEQPQRTYLLLNFSLVAGIRAHHDELQPRITA